MTSERQQRIEELFEELADLPPSEQRSRLDAACGGDEQLAAEVTALLAADAQGHPVLNEVPGSLARDLLGAADGHVVAGRIGRYVLERYLGEGGMSWVYLARREDLGDRVALKFLHDLWSSPSGRGRFAREQITLAGLSHRSIARLYDAGVTDGKPWFAMEYVEGSSIVAHCATRGADLRERLRLLRDACEAVNYAHRQLVVHLDLKPSNVLVTNDGEVKLLDFGIARHLAQEGAPVAATATVSRLLSLNYASPEQIRGERLDVQADVYALGVLLYELLAGSVPVDLTHLSVADLAAALEREPRRPSSARQTDTVAAVSKAEWRELDAVCAKALSRDKATRYQSVDRLMADIERFLRDEPLEASTDPFHYYRARKFLWRHRRAAAAAASVAAVISALVVFFNVRLIAARDAAMASEARLQRVHRLMLNLFDGDDAAAGPAEGLRVAELLERGVRDVQSLRSEPELQAELNSTLGGLFHKLGRLDRAGPLLLSALQTQQSLTAADDPRTIRPRLALATLRIDQSQVDAARQLAEESLAIARRHYAGDSLEVASAKGVLGKVFVADGNYSDGLPMLEEAVRILSTGPATIELSEALGDLANGLYYEGRVEEAEAVTRRALTLDQAVFGEQHPHVAIDFLNLGNIALDHANYAEGERLFRRALTIIENWYGKGHPRTANHVLMLGRTLAYQGRLADAAPLYEQALASFKAVYGEHHVRFASVLSLMGDLARERRQLDDAQRLFEHSAAIFLNTAGAEHEFYLHQLSNLASVDLARGRFVDAERRLRSAVVGLESAVPAQRYTGMAKLRLASALAGQKKYGEAEGYAESGVAILQQAASPASLEVQQALVVLGDIYAANSKPEEKRAVEQTLLRSRQARPN